MRNTLRIKKHFYYYFRNRATIVVFRVSLLNRSEYLKKIENVRKCGTAQFEDTINGSFSAVSSKINFTWRCFVKWHLRAPQSSFYKAG
jgi:hypothetical protein